MAYAKKPFFLLLEKSDQFLFSIWKVHTHIFAIVPLTKEVFHIIFNQKKKGGEKTKEFFHAVLC